MNTSKKDAAWNPFRLRKWKDSNKIGLKEIGFKGIDWVDGALLGVMAGSCVFTCVLRYVKSYM
jgi:hypothetical protein